MNTFSIDDYLPTRCFSDSQLYVAMSGLSIESGIRAGKDKEQEEADAAEPAVLSGLSCCWRYIGIMNYLTLEG